MVQAQDNSLGLFALSGLLRARVWIEIKRERGRWPRRKSPPQSRCVRPAGTRSASPAQRRNAGSKAAPWKPESSKLCAERRLQCKNTMGWRGRRLKGPTSTKDLIAANLKTQIWIQILTLEKSSAYQLLERKYLLAFNCMYKNLCGISAEFYVSWVQCGNIWWLCACLNNSRTIKK